MFNSSGDPTLMREGNDTSPSTSSCRCASKDGRIRRMTTLRLSELTISHFRSHKRVALEIDARPVVIYGANGVGKTNLIEAISLLSPGRGLRRSSAEDITRRPEAVGWKVRAVLHSLNQLHEIETWSEGGSARQVKVDSKASTQVALGRIGRLVVADPSNGPSVD